MSVLVRPLPLLALGLPAALLAGLAGPPAVIAAREPEMRVLLQRADQVMLRADAARPLRVRGGGLDRLALQRLEVRLVDGRLLLDFQPQGAPSEPLQRRELSAGTRLSLETDDPRGIWLAQRRYGGVLHLTVHDRQIQVVNQLGIEAYLASVVGSEMPQDWPMAALRAQAVAARTYALRQRGKAGSFDVQATVASQVYRGLESATPRTEEAVDSTRSLVMVHGGKLINAVFHSSSGGATEASGEVWRSQLPYLVSVLDHDQESPVHRWQARFDATQLRRAFGEIGGARSFQVLATSSTGRVRLLRVQGPAGSLRLSGRELRQRLGLKSTMVEFAWITDGAEPRDEDGNNDVPGGLSWDGTRWIGWLQAPAPPPLRPRPESGSQPVLEIRGRGFGHGVGMSQWGARALAERGADFRQILQHYYRGVQIRLFRPSDDPAVALGPALKPAWRG